MQGFHSDLRLCHSCRRHCSALQLPLGQTGILLQECGPSAKCCLHIQVSANAH